METPEKDFEQAIKGKDKISVIAEVKKRSPTHYKFDKHSVPTLVKCYEAGGASAISVVTDPELFDGSLELLEQVRELTSLPVIRKDFITTTKQVDDSWYAGADALLLIAHNLHKRELAHLINHTHSRAMDVLVEIYDLNDLKKIEHRNDVMIGINNRDLRTMRENVGHALTLLQRVDPARTIVAESAFSNADQLDQYKGLVDAALIGSSLLTATNPKTKLKSFL